jgi:aspartate aminotransferase
MAIAENIKSSLSKGSFIRKMFEEGITLKSKYGKDKVFDFSIGNPDIDPPKEFHELFVKLASEDLAGSHGYMPNAGYDFVRETIAKKASKEQGVTCRATDIVMTVGAAGGLNAVLKTILNPGDNVIVSRPYFVEYGSYIANHCGVISLVDSTADFSLDIEKIALALNEKTAAILINSPNNPTGKIYSQKTLDDLARLLRNHEKKTGRAVYLIGDEPYREIIYKGKIVPPLLASYENSIIVTSYSKSLSLPGERIGYIAINPSCNDYEMLNAGIIMSNRVLGFVNAPALMQRLVAGLTDITVDVGIYERKRDLLSEGLKNAGLSFVEPEGAFYLFVKAPGGDDFKFVDHLKKYLILAVPGTGFGGPGYFRLAYCVNETVIKNALPVFAEAVKNYKP